MTEEKNYQDIRTNFENKYANYVVPKLSPFDEERKKILKKSTIIKTVMIIIGIILLFFPTKFIVLKFIGLVFIFFSTVVRSFLQKRFERTLKQLVMPFICECFPDLKWTYSTEEIQKEANIYKTSGLLSYFDNSCFDDCFSGKYNDVGFEIREFKATQEVDIGGDRKTVTIFDGVIVILEMNKNFKGNTVLKPHGLTNNYTSKAMSVSMTFELGKKSKPEVEVYKAPNLRKTTLEDVEFNKKFDVYTDDEVEARYLLTTSLMERLSTIQTIFNANEVACSFYNQKFYIALSTRKDLFSIGSLDKEVYDKEQFDIMFEEILSIIKLIDHFKLNQKIGL